MTTSQNQTERLLEQVDERLRCHCWWRGERCENLATAEDGLCNWCAPFGTRSPHVLRTDKAAFIGLDGEFMGLGGRGQTHDSRYPGETPGACWHPNSGRTIGRG